MKHCLTYLSQCLSKKLLIATLATTSALYSQDTGDERGCGKSKTFCRLTVTGSAQIGTLFVLGDETVGGNLRIDGSLTVNGPTYLTTLFINGVPFVPTTGDAFVNGGNSFATATAILGNINAKDLNIITTNLTRMTINSAGAVTINPPTTGDALTVTANATDNALVLVGGAGAAAETITAGGTQTALDVLNGNINLTNSTSATTGNITKVGDRFIHNFGTSNTFMGVLAGNFTLTGLGNVGIGTNALTATTSGGANTAVGFNALAAATTGGANTAVGFSALDSLLTGLGNTALGRDALENVTAASSNTAVGDQAGKFVTGASNTLIGGNAGQGLTSGIQNVLIGRSSAQTLVTGSNNIVIGRAADVNNAARINAIVIGTGSTSTTDNEIRIGFGTAASTTCFIDGIAGAGPFLNAVTIDVVTGQLGGLVSARRFKENIKSITSEQALKLMQLRPTQYNYKNDLNKAEWYGFIAEEVEPFYPELIVHDAQGEISSINYNCLIALVVAALKNQQQTIDNLNNRIQVLEQS